MANTLHDRIRECFERLSAATTNADRDGYEAELQGLEAARDGFALRPERFIDYDVLRKRYEQGYSDGVSLKKIEQLHNVVTKED